MAMGSSLVFETASNTYRSVGIIGEGGSGRVYRATSGDGHVAVKVLHSEKAQGDIRKRFNNELQFGLRNTHRHLIRVLDYGVLRVKDLSTPFYVMPCYASSLRHKMVEGIPQDKALNYWVQLLDGVEAAHLLNVIHRDLKPENVLLDVEADILVVSDFGIARFLEKDLFTAVETASQARLANFQYAAPEQKRRGGDVDHRCDIYALGCILNELFTREVPHGTGYKTIQSVAPGFAYLDGIVERLLRQDRRERFSPVDEIKKQLLAHKNEWVTRQRLDAARATVIAEDDIDDPLVRLPLQVMGIDYREGRLILTLNQTMPPKWVQALRSIDRMAIVGAGPEYFDFRGEEASVSVHESGAKETVKYFKEWLPRATERYLEMLREENRKRAAELTRKLQHVREEEERRLRVLREIGL